eukprot:g32103.t1
MVDVLKFSYADVIARANRTSVEAAADQWIHEAMDEDTAADYDYDVHLHKCFGSGLTLVQTIDDESFTDDGKPLP